MLKCVALLCELPRHHIYQVLSCRFGIVYTIGVQMWSSRAADELSTGVTFDLQHTAETNVQTKIQGGFSEGRSGI